MTRYFQMVLLTLIVLAAPLTAEEEGGWQPPPPMPDDFDWVQLVSGEWLKGEIIVLYEEELEFDSEELDGLTIELGDIAVIRSARVLTWTFTDRRVVTGTAAMQKGIVRVRDSSGNVHEFPSLELLKVIEGDMSEINFWSMKASLGSTIRSGNTNQTDLNTAVKIRREATSSRIDLDYNGNYSEVDTAQTVNNTRIAAGWNIIITRGFFVSPLIGEIYADEFQNIDVRGTIGAGLGVFVVRNSTIEWSLQLGGAYRNTQYISVEPGEPTFNATGSVIPGTVIEWDITGDIDLDFNYNAQIGVPDTKDTTHHVQAYFSMDLFGDIIDLTANFTWDRIENPVTNAEGITPERDDYRLAFGIGVDL